MFYGSNFVFVVELISCSWFFILLNFSTIFKSLSIMPLIHRWYTTRYCIIFRSNRNSVSGWTYSTDGVWEVQR